MKKIITLLMFAVLLVGLSGCSASKLKEINKDEIFNQEGKYFVYFYQEDCEDCKIAKPIIEAYVKQIQTGNYENKNTVYAVNLSKKENKDILRAYNQVILGWGAGQGDGTYYVDNVTDADNLYIGATSALISVGVNSNGDKFSKFLISGNEGIGTYLSNYLQK